ncbi:MULTISPECIES: hypothetical protein [unclassified Leucobacter]|uniref:hypothetical protein n=1 Tax=unclassified Leucobacter TaxID=2621730 RepID=UPI00165E1932|nr:MULTISPECIES: hypothetical protein [unclassified Leucobacter]MBC9926703.1 hypothetical protein [Leucobacter sp. cx-169]
MTGSANRTPLVRSAALLSAVVLALGLSACAPEPDAMPTGKSNPEATTEPSWPEADAEETDKNRMLPVTFPGAFVPLPANPDVDNAGERGEGSWFVVLRADSLDAASAMLDQIATDGAFTVTEDIETGDGGRSATLTVDDYVVHALTLTEGKQALLSLDVSNTQV